MTTATIDAKNILITGIPRSGTSLFTGTLHKIPNSVALSEPVYFKKFKKSGFSPADYADELQKLVRQIRKDITEGRPIPNRYDVKSSEIATNYFNRVQGENGAQVEKTYEVREETIPVENAGFNLCIKNNAQFTACLDEIAKLVDFEIVTVVRNPLACILSWRSLNISISNGRQPGGEKFSKQLKKIRKIDDLLMRQVKIIDWYFETYHRCRDRVRLVRYEDFVKRPEMLREIANVPENFVFPQYSSMNKRKEYNFEEVENIRRYLNKQTEFVKRFYPEF